MKYLKILVLFIILVLTISGDALSDTIDTSKRAYFVSFMHGDGYGNAVVYLKKEVSSLEDIVDIQKFIEQDTGAENVTIMYYTKMKVTFAK